MRNGRFQDISKKSLWYVTLGWKGAVGTKSLEKLLKLADFKLDK